MKPEFNSETWDCLTLQARTNILEAAKVNSGLAFVFWGSMRRPVQDRIIEFVTRCPEEFPSENMNQPDLFLKDDLQKT